MSEMYDVVIVGGGPAGLTAAIYLARACYRVVVVEKEKFGGQITITSEVVNYPGSEPVSGTELTDRMRRQAENFGAEFMLAEVKALDMSGTIKKVTTTKGVLECFGVLLATGAHPRMIGFKGEAEFRGHGVAYCATCDGEFFTGKTVFVVGGGFAAAEESVFLTKYASHVNILIRKDDFSCAKATADEAKSNPKISVFTNTEVESVSGDDVLRKIIYKNNKTGEITTFAPENDTFGVFVFAGYSPSTELVKNIAELNEQGYIITDRQQKTSCEGLYAAGDVCVKNLRQVVTATGDGALAATELEKYAAKLQKETGIKPAQPVTHKTQVQNQKTEPQKSGALFDQDMIKQLNTVFSRMQDSLILELHLNNQEISRELENYVNELASLTDKITIQKAASPMANAPCVKVLKSDGSETGMAFHGVPGGHEFQSFVLGLYNMAGPGQKIDEAVKTRVQNLDRDINMQILVSLSCTMCPELVVSAQRIASLNRHVKTEVFDLAHFPDLRAKYNVMSVPCYVINDGKPMFGKKNIEQLMDVFENL